MEYIELIVKAISALLGVVTLTFAGIIFTLKPNDKTIKDYLKLILQIAPSIVGMAVIFNANEIAIFLEPYFQIETTMFYAIALVVMLAYGAIYSLIFAIVR